MLVSYVVGGSLLLSDLHPSTPNHGVRLRRIDRHGLGSKKGSNDGSEKAGWATPRLYGEAFKEEAVPLG
jgi:hypothetical protein